jgi:hypothetical protein
MGNSASKVDSFTTARLAEARMVKTITVGGINKKAELMQRDFPLAFLYK